MKKLLTGFLVVVFVFYSLPSVKAQQSSQTSSEIWLNIGREAFVFANDGTKPIAKFDVNSKAYYSAVSPDGSKLAIASFGEVEDKINWSGDREWYPKKNSFSTITLFNRPNNELIGQYKVQFRPRFIRFTPDGANLIIVSLGQYNKNTQKHLPPQIALMNAANGELHHQAEMVYWTGGDTLWYAENTNKLLVAGYGPGVNDKPQPELVVYDVKTGTHEKIKLPSHPATWRESNDENLRYLEMDDSIIAVNADGQFIGTPIQAGKEKSFFFPSLKRDKFYLAGHTKKQGQLIIVEAGQVTKKIDVPPLSYMIPTRDLTRFILCAEKEGIVVNAETLEEQGRIKMPGYFTDILLDADGKRLFLNGGGSNIFVIDIESKQQIAKFGTGRSGVKFGKMLAIAGLNVLSTLSYEMPYRMYGLTAPAYPGPNLYYPTEVKSMTLSKSGNHIYVYNSFSDDITVVETKNFTPLMKEPTGYIDKNQFMWQTPDGQFLIVCSERKLLVFETEQGKIVVEQEFPKTTLSYEPVLNKVLAIKETGTEVFQPNPLTKVKDLPAAKKVIFVPDEKRFFLISPKEIRLFDYDFNQLHLIEGTFKPDEIVPDNVLIIPSTITVSAKEKVGNH